MQVEMVGFGRMGANMARRLMNGGHECLAYNRNAEIVDALVKDGAVALVRSKKWPKSSTRRAQFGSCFPRVRPRRKQSWRFPNYWPRATR